MVELFPSVGVSSQCRLCDTHAPYYGRGRAISGFVWHKSGNPIRPWALIACTNYDDELRHVAEPFGFIVFAWRWRRCRNGKVRWLRYLERHDDGSYSLCNRAY